MNVILYGKTKEIVTAMVEEGYANTQSEAIRLAIVNFGQENFDEVGAVNRKLDRIDRSVREGKRRVLNADEALGKYSKYVK